jgi:hypothetical protein
MGCVARWRRRLKIWSARSSCWDRQRGAVYTVDDAGNIRLEPMQKRNSSAIPGYIEIDQEKDCFSCCRENV